MPHSPPVSNLQVQCFQPIAKGSCDYIHQNRAVKLKVIETTKQEVKTLVVFSVMFEITYDHSQREGWSQLVVFFGRFYLGWSESIVRRIWHWGEAVYRVGMGPYP